MTFYKVLAILFYPLFFSVVLFLTVFISLFLYSKFILKLRLPESIKIKKIPSKFTRIFFQFPSRLLIDLFNRDPYQFNEYGLHMFCGEQGSGKSIALVHKLQQFRNRYPKIKIRSNMGYKYEDDFLYTWQQLLNNDNGIYGQVEVLDEIQAWFSSNDSKNFPPDMLSEISQQRKQRKCILGTAQVFSRISKQIREQTSFVYCPVTIFGCLTIVRVTKPKYWDDEKQVFKRFIRTYFFVHTEELRNSFDTLKKISRYKEVGFQENKKLEVI